MTTNILRKNNTFECQHWGEQSTKWLGKCQLWKLGFIYRVKTKNNKKYKKNLQKL